MRAVHYRIEIFSYQSIRAFCKQKLKILVVILTHKSSVHIEIETSSHHFSHKEQHSNSNFELKTFLARLGTKSGASNILQLCSLYMTMPK